MHAVISQSVENLYDSVNFFFFFDAEILISSEWLNDRFLSIRI
jgi:hypothetical protein